MTEFVGHQTRSQLTRRLRSLSVLEAVNIGLIGGVLFLGWRVHPSAANVAGFAMVALLLAEGSAYWALKFRQVRSGGHRAAGMAVFRLLRTTNVALFAISLAVIGLGLWRQPGGYSWPGLILWLFAVAEHINYFHVQLSYQTRADLRRLRRSRQLRRSHLADDLARTGGRSRSTGGWTDLG